MSTYNNKTLTNFIAVCIDFELLTSILHVLDRVVGILHYVAAINEREMLLVFSSIFFASIFSQCVYVIKLIT